MKVNLIFQLKWKTKFNVYKEITYNGKIFIEERHKIKDYPNIITYRCKNQRKNERLLHSYFCNAIVKKKVEKNKCFYILEKDHSEDCNNLITKKKEAPKIINDYNDYIQKCFTVFHNILDSHCPGFWPFFV